MTGIFNQWGKFLPLAPFFATVIDVCYHSNWEMVTNNLTAVIKVALIDVSLSEALLYVAKACCHQQKSNFALGIDISSLKN